MDELGSIQVERGDEDPTRLDVASDDAIRDVVEVLLAARRASEAGMRMNVTAQVTALTQTAFLAKQLGAWAALDLGLLMSPDAYQKLTIEERRTLIAASQFFQLPAMQPQARKDLEIALAGLNVGDILPLFKKTSTGRRRAAPHVTVAAEMDILCWIRWQHGLGRLVSEAEAEAAEAVHCTPNAFAQWTRRLTKIFGKERMPLRLAEAENLGRVEAAVARGEPLPDGIDEQMVVWLEGATFRRDLHAIAEDRRRAMQKRRKPE